ncbi:hypothetical protein LY76DRAFT_166491 [Colletotrichum caudatum]|nr:hypothetical protein LY76DRAFT_166491 [Colletotrichum caudatum]
MTANAARARAWGSKCWGKRSVTISRALKEKKKERKRQYLFPDLVSTPRPCNHQACISHAARRNPPEATNVLGDPAARTSLLFSVGSPEGKETSPPSPERQEVSRLAAKAGGILGVADGPVERGLWSLGGSDGLASLDYAHVSSFVFCFFSLRMSHRGKTRETETLSLSLVCSGPRVERSSCRWWLAFEARKCPARRPFRRRRRRRPRVV